MSRKAWLLAVLDRENTFELRKILARSTDSCTPSPHLFVSLVDPTSPRRAMVMPIERSLNLGDDTTGRLELAAKVRYREAVYLAEGGHHLASIYLAGYASEMTLGSVYFSVVREYGPKTIITAAERNRIVRYARLLSEVEDQSHPIDGLARYLIQEKSTINPPAFSQGFAEDLILRVVLICRFWAPRLRYRSIEATAAQSRIVLDATSWILKNRPRL